MNSVYSAKKKRIPDALHLLLVGDAKGAREALRHGGINLADEPVRANPEGRQNNSWRFKFEGDDEEEINLRKLTQKFFPELYPDI
jgi:hypothetical protein